MPPEVTMHDIAESAGVSVTTVSHVINQTRPVSEKLRVAVRGAMEELGYQPNLVARSLRRGRTHTIGMVAPDSSNPYFAEIAHAVEAAAFAQGYSVILCNTQMDMAREAFYANVLLEKRVDGIIFVAAGDSAQQIRALQQRRQPIVLVDRDVQGVAADAVTMDNTRGARQAVEHLLALGHRRIACISGPSAVTPSSRRIGGYTEALSAAGLPVDAELIVRGDFQFESGLRLADQLLDHPQPPTAIFASNDLMAVGVIHAVLRRRLRVPEDISVVGFDDIRLAAYINPALTTVAQPKELLGQTATRLLLERIDNPDWPPRVVTLETALVVRQSTGPRLA
jgi:LacI family transcriptional regulator